MICSQNDAFAAPYVLVLCVGLANRPQGRVNCVLFVVPQQLLNAVEGHCLASYLVLAVALFDCKVLCHSRLCGWVVHCQDVTLLRFAVSCKIAGVTTFFQSYFTFFSSYCSMVTCVVFNHSFLINSNGDRDSVTLLRTIYSVTILQQGQENYRALATQLSFSTAGTEPKGGGATQACS